MAPVTGTNGNDIITFQGNLQQYTATLVNPYSGETIFVDAVKNVNTTTYNGLAGTDLISMSAYGDVLHLNDGSGNATISSIERIVAGAGGDVIILADSTLVLGDILVAGGEEDDIIWTNAGNDTVLAGDGDDIVDGGPGNDSLSGENGNDRLSGGAGNDLLNGGNGNDTVYGGTGNDRLFGGSGDDVLYGDDGPGSNPALYAHTVTSTHSFTGADYYLSYYNQPSNINVPVPNQGISTGNAAISFATTITATYLFSEAGYQNSLGFYKIGADGTIGNVEIVMKNQHAYAYGTVFTYDYDGSAGD